MLDPGGCATLPFNLARDERNPGSGPATVLTLAVVPDYYPVVPPDRAPEILFAGELVFDQSWWGSLPPGSLAVSLRRADLTPDTVVAPYAGGGLGTTVPIFDPTNHLCRRRRRPPEARVVTAPADKPGRQHGCYPGAVVPA